MGLHVIIGTDDFLVEEAARKIIGDGVGLETIDSRESSNEERRLDDIRRADDSFSTPPFLDPKKTTWWRNVNFLPGAGRKGADEAGSSAAVKAALEKFAKKLAADALPDNQAFIITGTHLLKTSTFAKTLAKAAQMTYFGGGSPWEAARAAQVRARELARLRGLVFAPGADDRLVARVGADTRSLASEIDKLAAYLDAENRQVGPSDVDAVCCPGAGAEPAAWAVTDAVGARNLREAIRVLREFERESGFEILMSSLLEKFFRNLAEMKASDERGRLDEALAGMKPFVARKTRQQLAGWSLRELRAARARFMALRELAVSGNEAVSTRIFTELVRVCRRASR